MKIRQGIAACLLMVSPAPITTRPLAPVACMPTRLDGEQAVLDEARSLMRKGLLAEAQDVLDRLSPLAGAQFRAHAALLTGNIAYERGHYTEARTAYESSEALFSDAASRDSSGAEPGIEAARANRRLAGEQVERADDFARQASRLRGVTWAALAAVVVGAGWLARSSRPTPKSADGTRRQPH